ncbi:MAG: hypothetical protein IT438_11550 [Phycisphaerales bacterium]|nr:hypothetical protein [Phycisphaerales bacterium]
MNRGTCQRVLLAVRAGGESGGVEVLKKGPGVEGLGDFVRALATRVGRRPEIDRAEAMVQDYALLVQRLGGSQAKLIRLASQDASEDDGRGVVSPREEQVVSARRAIYQAAQVTTGTWCAASVALQAFCPSVAEKGKLDTAHARGFIGMRRRADGMALSSMLSGDVSKLTTLDGEGSHGRQWSALLAEFCTIPLPTVISKVEGDKVHSIVLGDNAVERPVDIILGGRGIGAQPDPRYGGPSYLTTVFGLRFPARLQVYDFYVHKALSAGGKVRSCALALSPKDIDPVLCWYDKLAYEPTVRPMGAGIVGETLDSYPRMGELAAHLFSRSGWNPDDFEAWRVELTYPSPAVAYTITLHPPGSTWPQP